VYTLINAGKVCLFSKFGVLGCGGVGSTSSMLVRGLCCWLIGVFDPVVCWWLGWSSSAAFGCCLGLSFRGFRHLDYPFSQLRLILEARS
jgi:hypothetical protein